MAKLSKAELIAKAKKIHAENPGMSPEEAMNLAASPVTVDLPPVGEVPSPKELWKARADNIKAREDRHKELIRNNKSAASPLVRVGAATKATRAGEHNFLLDQLLNGRENAVMPDGYHLVEPIIDSRTGEQEGLSVFDEETGERNPVDLPFGKGGATEAFTDIAEAAPDVAEGAVGTAIGAGTMAATRNPALAATVGNAAGGATANALRQGVSALLPGDDEMTASGRLLSAGVAGGAELTAGAIGAGARRALGAPDFGMQRAERLVRKGEFADLSGSGGDLVRRKATVPGEQLFREGRELGKELDIDYSLEQTLRKSADPTESVPIDQLRKDKAAVISRTGVPEMEISTQVGRQKQAASAFRRRVIDENLKNIEQDPIKAGEAIGKASKDEVATLALEKSDAVSPKFREAQLLAKNAKPVPQEQASKVMADLVVKLDPARPEVTDDAKKLFKSLQEGFNNKSISPDVLEARLVSWNRVARGETKLYTNSLGASVADGKRMVKALQDDLDSLAASGPKGARIVQLIREGNEIAKGYNEKIEAAEKSMAHEILGLSKTDKAGEILDHVLSANPARVKAYVAALGESGRAHLQGQALLRLQRETIESDILSPSDLVRYSENEQLMAILDPEARKAFDRVVAAAKRLQIGEQEIKKADRMVGKERGLIEAGRKEATNGEAIGTVVKAAGAVLKPAETAGTLQILLRPKTFWKTLEDPDHLDKLAALLNMSRGERFNYELWRRKEQLAAQLLLDMGIEEAAPHRSEEEKKRMEQRVRTPSGMEAL